MNDLYQMAYIKLFNDVSDAQRDLRESTNSWIRQWEGSATRGEKILVAGQELAAARLRAAQQAVEELIIGAPDEYIS